MQRLAKGKDNLEQQKMFKIYHMVWVLKTKYYKQTKTKSLPAEKPRINVCRRHNSDPLNVDSINYTANVFCISLVIWYIASALDY